MRPAFSTTLDNYFQVSAEPGLSFFLWAKEAGGQGAGSREQGAGGREQGAGSREQGVGEKDSGIPLPEGFQAPKFI